MTIVPIRGQEKTGEFQSPLQAKWSRMRGRTRRTRSKAPQRLDASSCESWRTTAEGFNLCERLTPRLRRSPSRFAPAAIHASSPFHILRTIRRDIEPYGRINSVPKTNIGNGNTKFVEPRRKVPRNKRTAREAKEKYPCRNSVLRQSFVVRLKPPPRGAECRSPVNARNPPSEIRAEMRSKPSFKMKLLP